ncbi:MAG: hypothetical protein ACLUFM_03150 [Lachnospiraceae bacterium]
MVKIFYLCDELGGNLPKTRSGRISFDEDTAVASKKMKKNRSACAIAYRDSAWKPYSTENAVKGTHRCPRICGGENARKHERKSRLLSAETGLGLGKIHMPVLGIKTVSRRR